MSTLDPFLPYRERYSADPAYAQFVDLLVLLLRTHLDLQDLQAAVALADEMRLATQHISTAELRENVSHHWGTPPGT